MDHILKITFCLILIGIYWNTVADSAQCNEVGFLGKCKVCTDDENCPRCRDQNLECRHDNRCRCKEGFGIKNGNCEIPNGAVKKFDEICNADQNILCTVDDSLHCEPVTGDGKCVCLIGYERHENVGLCIRPQGLILDKCSAEPNDTCNKNQPLKCDKGKHKCLVKKGYKYNCETEEIEKGDKGYLEACDEASCNYVGKACNPCIPDLDLECQNEVCVCKEGYYWDGKCMRYAEYIEACESVLCNPESNLECRNRTFCDCKEGSEYDEDEKWCVICEEEGATLQGVLIAILVVVYAGVLCEVGLIVWLVRRHRRVHPADAEEGSPNQSESKKKKGKKDKKFKKSFRTNQNNEK